MVKDPTVYDDRLLAQKEADVAQFSKFTKGGRPPSVESIEAFISGVAYGRSTPAGTLDPERKWVHVEILGQLDPELQALHAVVSVLDQLIPAKGDVEQDEARENADARRRIARYLLERFVTE